MFPRAALTKGPQTWWLETTEVCSLTIPGGQKSGQAVTLPPTRSKLQENLPLPLETSGSSDALGLWQNLQSLPLCLLTLLLCICVLSSSASLRTLVIGFGSHPGVQG